MMIMPPAEICLSPTRTLACLCLLMPYLAPNTPISDKMFAPSHPIFLKSGQMMQILQLNQIFLFPKQSR